MSTTAAVLGAGLDAAGRFAAAEAVKMWDSKWSGFASLFSGSLLDTLMGVVDGSSLMTKVSGLADISYQPVAAVPAVL
jgi:hypothetical protein